MPDGVDSAEAAAVILSWTTAHQLLHRSARVTPGQRVLVHGAAGAVGQALLVLGKKAGLELWGTCRAKNAQLVRSLGATRVAERISFGDVAEAHRRLEAGGLDGKLVLCPELETHAQL